MSEKRLNWGLAGAGDIARKRIAPALRDAENCRFVAVARGRAALAEEFAREFGAPKWFASYDEMIADRELDAVYLATPVDLHKAQTIAAAEAGLHVLCEKPLALSAADGAAMIAACRYNGVRLGVAYYRRFYPILGRVRELLAAGEIGRAAVVQMNAFEYFDPPADHPRAWLLDKAKSGGGPMMDFGCHRIEVLTNLFGAPRRVTSVVSNAIFERGVEDTALALFEFDGGTCAALAVTHAAHEPQDTLDIYGTEGSIHIPVLNGAEIRIKTASGERLETHPPPANFHRPLIEEFADAVLGGRDPQVTGECGREIAEIEDAIYGSIERR